MNRRMRLIFFMGLTFWLILGASSIPSGQTSGEETPGVFIEDFSTTDYMDAENTTVEGWGTGPIRCPRKSPELVDLLPISFARDVFVDGDYAYVASEEYQFCVVDISDPTNTALAVALTTPYDVQSLVVSGHRIGMIAL